jgi:GTPase
VILLQVDPASSDELETVSEGCYETEDTSIFVWSSVPDVGHYRWLRGSIRRLLSNSKADYLICTI